MKTQAHAKNKPGPKPKAKQVKSIVKTSAFEKTTKTGDTAPLVPHQFHTVTSQWAENIILIPPNILHDMGCIIGLSDKEVGWLGFIDRLPEGYLITEVFVPEQVTSSAETEISEEGISIVATELMGHPDGMEKVNKLRLWGHSHPWGSTSPSGPDVTQTKALMKDIDDFFIRAIAGKNGRIEFTLFVKDLGLTITDCPWQLHHQVEYDHTEYWHSIMKKNITHEVWGGHGAWVNGA